MININVISLDTERRKKFIERMDGKLEYSIFDAYTPATINGFDKLFQNSDIHNYASQYNVDSVIACAKSHFEVWRTCVKLNTKMLILEDDVRFTDTGAEIALNSLMKSNINYDVFYLDGQLGEKYKIRKPYQFHSGCAYIITPKHAQHMIDHVLNNGFKKALDWELLEQQLNGFKYLTFERAVLIPNGEKSNIKI